MAVPAWNAREQLVVAAAAAVATAACAELDQRSHSLQQCRPVAAAAIAVAAAAVAAAAAAMVPAAGTVRLNHALAGSRMSGGSARVVRRVHRWLGWQWRNGSKAAAFGTEPGVGPCCTSPPWLRSAGGCRLRPCGGRCGRRAWMKTRSGVGSSSGGAAALTVTPPMCAWTSWPAGPEHDQG